MNALDALFELLESGILLRVDGSGDGAQLRFRAAPGVLTPLRRAMLGEIKPQLLEWLAPGVEYLPLSLSQQGLWLLHRWDPQSAFYNMPLVVRLRGDLHRDALARSFHLLQTRHEALRTTFPVLQGRALQAIAPPAELAELPLHDLSTLPATQRENEATRLVREEVLRPFDLERGPLWRTRLLRLGERDHILAVTLHHVISDGWSLRILFGELQTFYSALAQNEACGDAREVDAILPPATGYSDFTLWQRQWLQTDTCREHIEYWRNQLSELPPLLKFPTDRPRPPQPIYRGALHVHQLSPALTEALRAFSRDFNVSLFMTLLAAFQVVLRQRAAPGEAAREVRVGATIANRGHAQTENTAGFFAGALVLRSGLTGAATWNELRFEELLARVRDNALDAYSHQDAPLETILDALVENDLSRYPDKRRQRENLFQILFILQNVPDMALQLPGLDVEFERIPTETSRIDLTIAVWEKPEGLQFTLEYDTDILEADTMSRLATHFERVLQAIVANPQSTLAQLPAWPGTAEYSAVADETSALEITNPIAHNSEFLAPRDELENQLASIWRSLLNCERIGVRDDFFDVGGHSMLAVRLLDQVESLTGQKLTLAMFFQAPTIEAQAVILRREQALDSPSLVTLQALGTHAPLFCVDGAVRYRALARHLAPEQPVYGLIPEAATDGEWFAFTRVGERVAHYVREIQRVQPHGPYYLAGLSFGGLVAFGVAQSLRACGERVALLALFDTYGPGYLTMSWRRRLGWHWKAWTNLETEERVAYIGRRVRARWQRLAAQPRPETPESDAEAIADDVEDAWQIDIMNRPLKPDELRALRGFARQTRRNPEAWRYEGNLLLFTAQDKESEFLSIDPLLGWGEVAAHIETYSVPGNHVGILREPNVRVLAAHLQAAIRAARRDSADV